MQKTQTFYIYYPRAHHAFTARPRCGDTEKETLNISLFQYRFDILLKMRLSGVAEQI